MKPVYARLKWLILQADTVAVRFWFSLAGLGFCVDTLSGPISAREHAMFLLAPQLVWFGLFALHACALLHGVFTKRFNTVLLMLEGVLGTALWGAVSVVTMLTQGGPNATVAGALIAFWLLVRYPTHWEYTDGR